MMKLPVPVQLGSPDPPVNVQVPDTTPLLSVPTVPGVPLVVPVRPPSGAVSVRTLLLVVELILKVILPVT
jgi:hypothetical protein